MERKARILICDDEQGMRESLGIILRDKYELYFANDGLAALEHIQKCHTDLVLLDLKMPKLDGIKALKEIKKLEPEIKVIVVTGYASISTAYSALKYGASDYIPKPFDKEHILTAIEKALN